MRNRVARTALFFLIIILLRDKTLLCVCVCVGGISYAFFVG
jgi:hypothetical protein